MDPVQLYSPEGVAYTADTPAVLVQLRSAGYTEKEPENVVPQVDIQHPENHSVQDVQAFIAANPTLEPAVVEAEKARGDKARKSIVGES